MRVLAACLLLLICSQGWATQTALSQPLVESVHLFNDSQLLESYALLEDYNTKNPDDATGIFLLALVKWRIMWISGYNSSDRQDLTALLQRVEQVCQTQIENKDCLFLNASVNGIRAQIAATENQWWDTAQLGKKMKHQAEKILEADEEYYPAYYLLGSFNYFADALPGYLKFLRSLVFLPGGDRNTGVKQLIMAYQKGGVVSGEAGRTLAMIYTFYQRTPQYGTKMCDNLLITYPNAYDVGLYRGINLYFDKSWQQSLDQLRTVQRQIMVYSSKHAPAREHPIEVKTAVSVYFPLERETRYWISRNLIQMENYAEAKRILMELANPPLHQPYWLIRWVYLSLAQIEYHNQNREAAEMWLDKVVAWKDVKDSTQKAKLLRKKKGKVDTFEIDVR